MLTDGPGRTYPTEANLPVSTNDNELLSTIRFLMPANRRRRPTAQTAPLEGHVEDDVFPELLQFLFVSGKVGRVVVTDGPHRGTTYVAEGEVLHTELDGHRGPAAFEMLCFLGRGRFRYEPNARPTRRTMRHNGVELLLESARRKDLRERRGTTDRPQVAWSSPSRDRQSESPARTRAERRARRPMEFLRVAASWLCFLPAAPTWLSDRATTHSRGPRPPSASGFRPQPRYR